MNNNTTFIIIMAICGILVAYIVIKNVKIEDFSTALPVLQLPTLFDPTQGTAPTVSTPTQGIPVDTATPTQGIPVDTATPTQGIPVDTATPTQGIPVDTSTPTQIPTQAPMPSLFPTDAPPTQVSMPPPQMPIPELSPSEMIKVWNDDTRSPEEHDMVTNQLLNYMNTFDMATLGTYLKGIDFESPELSHMTQQYKIYKQRLMDEDVNKRQEYSDYIQSLNKQITAERTQLATLETVENFTADYKHIAAYVEDPSIANNMADFRMFRQ
jgi:hypothetical protein